MNNVIQNLLKPKYEDNDGNETSLESSKYTRLKFKEGAMLKLAVLTSFSLVSYVFCGFLLVFCGFLWFLCALLRFLHAFLRFVYAFPRFFRAFLWLFYAFLRLFYAFLGFFPHFSQAFPRFLFRFVYAFLRFSTPFPKLHQGMGTSSTSYTLLGTRTSVARSSVCCQWLM